MKTVKRFLLIFTIGATVAVLALTAAALVSKDVAWRLVVLKEKLTGKIPEIPFLTLLRWMRPGSPVYLGGLSEVPNVNTSINTLFNDRRSAEVGARIYGRQCGGCHGENLRGRTGPNLLAALGNLTDWSFFATVKWGRPRTIMTAQPLSDLEIWQMYAYARQMSLEEAVGKKPSNEEIRPFPAVTFETLREGDRSGDWLTYAGNYAGYRHSLQNQISRLNVQQLRLVWAAQLRADSPSLEATPIVTAGRMFVTQ
jgi:mono/diheme cytochrome c family protein